MKLSMIHFPIVKNEDPDQKIEFSHFDRMAPRGTWKKENIILRRNIKINVFMRGEFGVFSDGKIHHPSQGDLCIFPPQKQHYGQILKDTYLEYYQLDFGTRAFEQIPGGAELLKKIIRVSQDRQAFVRPNEEEKRELFSLCNQIEESIRENSMSLAYAKCVEFLEAAYRIYLSGGKTASFFLSSHTLRAIEYIEENFSEPITLSKIAEEIGVSSSYLSRSFQKDIGVGVHSYLNQYRIKKALHFLRDHSVTDTCYLCGFCDGSHFISVFKKHMNITPMIYKQSLEKKLEKKA